MLVRCLLHRNHSRGSVAKMRRVSETSLNIWVSESELHGGVNFPLHLKRETLKRSILPARWACEEEIHKFTLMWLVAVTQYNVCICSNANDDEILNSNKIGGYEIPMGGKSARGWTDKYSNHSSGSYTYMWIMILINAQIDGNNWLEIRTQSKFLSNLTSRSFNTEKETGN